MVHARGAAAHGVFQGYGTAGEVWKAAFLAKDVEAPLFDTLLCAGAPAPGGDAHGARDAKAGGAAEGPDTRVLLLLTPRRTGTARPSAAGTMPRSSSEPLASPRKGPASL